MMEFLTNSERQQIAADFVDLHKSDLPEWLPLESFDEDTKLMTIYYNLAGDVYGNLDIYEDIAHIEVSQFESKSGRPEIFEFQWEYEND